MTCTTAKRDLVAILVGGASGALLDAAYFSAGPLIEGKSPAGVLRNIAQFWLGRESMHMGFRSAAIGLVTHVALATLMAAGFVALARRCGAVRRSPLRGGFIYGAAIYATMYLFVLPLRWPSLFPRWDGWSSIADFVVHVLMGMLFAVVFKLVNRGDRTPFPAADY